MCTLSQCSCIDGPASSAAAAAAQQDILTWAPALSMPLGPCTPCAYSVGARPIMATSSTNPHNSAIAAQYRVHDLSSIVLSFPCVGLPRDTPIIMRDVMP